MPRTVPVTLYMRRDCHLCEQARATLLRAGRAERVTPEITRVDIDTDPALVARYGDRIPVALLGDHELAWPFTDRDARQLLAAAR